MKKCINKLPMLILITALMVPFYLTSQTIYGYGYDLSGNRISRYVIELRSANSSGEEEKEKIYEDKIGEKDIKIYPNPTEGFIYIETPIKENEPEYKFEIFNVNGVLVSTQKSKSEKTSISLHDNVPGAYLLKISFEKYASEWIIIKK